MKLPLLILVLVAISGAFAMDDKGAEVEKVLATGGSIPPCRCQQPGVSNAGKVALKAKCDCGPNKGAAKAGQFCCGPDSSVLDAAFEEGACKGKTQPGDTFDASNDGCSPEVQTAPQLPDSRFRSAVRLGQKISGEQKDEKAY